MQLQGTTIRIACNQAARDSFVNALGGQPPVFPRAGSVRMPCAIFLDDPSVPANLLTDLGNLVSAHCVIRAGDAAGAVLFEQIIPAARFNPALTFAQWTGHAAAHFEFTLTPTDTNLPPGPLHVAVGVTTDAGGDIPLGYCSTARLRDFGIFDAAAPAAPDYTSWSKAEADARYAPRPAAETCDVYVDAHCGNDAYHGRTPDAPLRTLRAARAACARVGAGVRLALARGSSWRESLDLSALADATAQSYGAGCAPPVIDGADVAAAWTAQPGTSFVFATTVTHDATDTSRLTVYEDGALLARVADQAACDALPGSFVDVKGSDGSPVAVRVHATGGGNPASNGKLYEITTRSVALAGGPGFTCAGIQAMRAISNNGALDLSARTGLTLSRLLTLDGTKHNAVIGAGTVRDSVAVHDDPPTSYEPSNVAWTGYLPDPTGLSLLFERCGTLGIRGNDYLGHGNGPESFTSSILRQCWTLDTSFTNIPGGSSTRLAEGCYCRGTAQAPNAGTWSQCLIYLPQTADSDAATTYEPTYQHTACYAETRYPSANYLPVFKPSSGYTFNHSAFVGLNTYDTWFSTRAGGVGSAGTMNAGYSVFYGGTRPTHVPAGIDYAGDYNVYFCTKPQGEQFYAGYHGTDYTTLASWQAATGQDAHSVYLSAADQSAGGANAFWLGYKNAAAGTSLATVGPKAGDWRINPAARVYAADGTAFVGTFADGTTPITLAGPQTHWDWNARASAAGAPTVWPTVPANLADARAYVLQPDAWVF